MQGDKAKNLSYITLDDCIQLSDRLADDDSLLIIVAPKGTTVEAPLIREDKKVVENKIVISTEESELMMLLCERGKIPVPFEATVKERRERREAH